MGFWNVSRQSIWIKDSDGIVVLLLGQQLDDNVENNQIQINKTPNKVKSLNSSDDDWDVGKLSTSLLK